MSRLKPAKPSKPKPAEVFSRFLSRLHEEIQKLPPDDTIGCDLLALLAKVPDNTAPRAMNKRLEQLRKIDGKRVSRVWQQAQTYNGYKMQSKHRASQTYCSDSWTA